MNFFNRTSLLGLCVFLSCMYSSAYAAPKKTTINQDLQQAYNILFKKQSPKQVTVKKSTPAVPKKIPARYRATQIAKKQIRKKYRFGGTTPRTGFDCSGLTQYAYKSVKVNLPRTARAQYKYTKRIPLAKIQVGDLIFFHTRRTRARVNHVGIYLGGGKFIHAPRKGKRVSVTSLNKYWRRKAVGAGRV